MLVIPLLLSVLLALAAPSAPPTVDPRAAVERIAELIEQGYYDPEVAARIARELTTDLTAGKFDALRDPRELAAVLTDRLRREDAHFSVNWSPPPPPISVEGPPRRRYEFVVMFVWREPVAPLGERQAPLMGDVSGGEFGSPGS